MSDVHNTYNSVGVHLGAGARFVCHIYPHDPQSGPIMVIDAAGLSFMLANGTRGAVEAGDVANARRLLEVVTEFAAEVERLHALNAEPADPVRDAAA